MSTTVALSFNEIENCINWLLQPENAKKGKAHAIKGKAHAAIMALMFLTGGRISEVLNLKIQDIADGSLHLHPQIQMENSKRKRKYTTVNIKDPAIIEKVKQLLVNTGDIEPNIEITVNARITPQKTKKMRSMRNVRIDNSSALASVIENWLKLDRSEQGHINPAGYAFTLGLGLKAKKITRYAAYDAFVRVFKALNLNYVSRGTHCLRKASSLSHYLVNKDASSGDSMTAFRITQRFLGHSKIDSTTNYVPVGKVDETEIASAHASKIKIPTI